MPRVCAKIASASGSSPFSRATVARVRRFLLIGPVEILDLGERRGLVDRGGELVRQLALRLDRGFDFVTAGLQIFEVLQARLERAERRVVHRAVRLLAVTGDEGNGVALVQQGDDVLI